MENHRLEDKNWQRPWFETKEILSYYLIIPCFAFHIYSFALCLMVLGLMDVWQCFTQLHYIWPNAHIGLTRLLVQNQGNSYFLIPCFASLVHSFALCPTVSGLMDVWQCFTQHLPNNTRGESQISRRRTDNVPGSKPRWKSDVFLPYSPPFLQSFTLCLKAL